MKGSFITFITILSCSLHAQVPAYNSFYCNGVKGWSNTIGGLFQIPSNIPANGGFIVNPQNETDNPTSSIFSISPNVAGYANGNLRGIFNSSNNLVNDPYLKFVKIPGPLETAKNYFPGYNRFWTVRKWEIQSLINDYNDNGIIDHEPTLNVLEWPARGNDQAKELNGISWPDRDLAPFYDRNNDGKYDPYDGDFPILESSCAAKIPSEMTWSLYHSSSGDLEIQTLMYGFASDYIPLLNNTIFARIKVFNQNLVLKDAKFGLFYDFDLGCMLDDYIGTSSINNTIYVYNKFETDQSPCNIGGKSYNSFNVRSPMQSITCLNRAMTGSIIYDKEDAKGGSNDPNSPDGYYKYISTKYLNDASLTYGGSGFNINSTSLTNYIFPDSPSNENGWSMMSQGAAMNDPRGFMNFNLDKIVKNQSVVLDFAFSYHIADLTTDHLSRVDSMLVDISSIKKFYNSCINSDDLKRRCDNNCVWPGDTDNNGIVNNLDILNIGANFNDKGVKRNQNSDWWGPFYAEDWNQTTPDLTNMKYLDCNGSGTITTNDLEIVKNNFFSANYSNTSWGGYNSEGEDLTFGLEYDSLNVGDEFVLDLILSPHKYLGLYGLGFTVEYDAELLDYVQGILEVSWLDKKGGPYSIVKAEKGKVHFGVVKKFGNDVQVKNVDLGRIKFRVKKQITGRHLAIFKYSNYEKINASGELLPLYSSPTSMVIHDPNTTSPKNFTGLILYPNPAKEMVFIKNNYNTFVQATLIDYLGKQSNITVTNNSFATDKIANGAYIVKLRKTDGSTSIERLVILK